MPRTATGKILHRVLRERIVKPGVTRRPAAPGASCTRRPSPAASGGRVVLTDTITRVDADDGGAFVVAASHGGTSSGEFALLYPLAAVFFNDAGVGKDDAGIAALAMLQARGIAAGAVSHHELPHRRCRGHVAAWRDLAREFRGGRARLAAGNVAARSAAALRRRVKAAS